MVDGDPLEIALALAAKVVAEKRPLRRVRDIRIDYPNHEFFLNFARNMVGGMSKNFPAPLKCLDAIEAAVTKKSFADGFRVENELFLQLMQTPESRALRHLFFAERAASHIADIGDDTPVRKIERVGIIGAGTMGGGIAMNFVNAGIAVTLLETKPESPGSRYRHHPQKLRGRAQEGQAHPGEVRAAPGPAQRQPRLCRPRHRRSDYRSGVRRDRRQGTGLQELDEIAKPVPSWRRIHRPST